ncbi:hypothetical protein, partial [Anaerococcus hydrogenalis]|uniref:hypothetical protein n=1 Tax=Anaerococcus hydrogenalis TaxID=33029 RepID=UPI001DCCBCA8
YIQTLTYRSLSSSLAFSLAVLVLPNYSAERSWRIGYHAPKMINVLSWSIQLLRFKIYRELLIFLKFDHQKILILMEQNCLKLPSYT